MATGDLYCTSSDSLLKCQKRVSLSSQDANPHKTITNITYLISHCVRNVQNCMYGTGCSMIIFHRPLFRPTDLYGVQSYIPQSHRIDHEKYLLVASGVVRIRLRLCRATAQSRHTPTPRSTTTTTRRKNIIHSAIQISHIRTGRHLLIGQGTRMCLFRFGYSGRCQVLFARIVAHSKWMRGRDNRGT